MNFVKLPKYIIKKEEPANIMLRYIPLVLVLLSLFITSCGTTFRLSESEEKRLTSDASGRKIEEGIASWYGPNFHGKLTANGEKYDMYGLTAAHRTLPFNSIVKVKNLDNGKSVQVRINDRGPYAKNRIIDLSKKAAQKIGMLGPGTAKVELILLKGNIDNGRITNLKIPTYTVQLASYTEEGQAFTHAQKIRGSRVEKITLNQGIVYRVYFGTYVDREKARSQQQKLKQQGFHGYVKQIQNY